MNCCPKCKSKKGFSIQYQVKGKGLMKIDFQGNLIDIERNQYDELAIYAHCIECNYWFDSALVKEQISKH